MFELREYQIELLNKINNSSSKRKCVTLATGGGKTVIFQELIKSLKGSTLVLVHRTELMEQTNTNADIFMAQTFTRRKIDANKYDNLIIDECHRGEFTNIAKEFKGNLYGFTATPMAYWSDSFYRCDNCNTVSKVDGKCCGRKLKKKVQKVPLSSVYGELIEGASISFLLENNYLVEDLCYELPSNLLDKLVFDSNGRETNESARLVFGSPDALQNTVNTYKKICLEKKTIIFNSNTVINRLLHEKFIANGFTNVRRIDSKGGDKRKEAIEWFKNTPNAILLNVHILTTGFDVTDVQSIILNKATKSLPLFLQMVGRGGRITDKIYKPTFDVIDLGGNIKMFGRWSDSRNWLPLYTDDSERGTKEVPLNIRQCHECEFIMPVVTMTCPNCGALKKFEEGSFAIPVINGVKPLPNIDKIVDYCKKNDLSFLDARKIVYKYFSDMFIGYPFDDFVKNKNNGKLRSKLKTVITPMYFKIQKSGLKGNICKRLDSFINECIKKIDRDYDRS